MPCCSLGNTWYNAFKVGRGLPGFFWGYSGLEKRPKKKVRHTFRNLESQKQVYSGYGVKNRRIGASALMNPLHSQQKKERKTKRKKSTKRGKRGLHPFIWSPPAAVNSTLLKHLLTHSLTRKKNEKKAKKSTQTGKRGPEPAHRTSYCCKQYIINYYSICHLMMCSAYTNHTIHLYTKRVTRMQ